MFRVVLSVEAERELARLPRDVYLEFHRAFDALERNPLEPGPRYRVKTLREPRGRRVIRFGIWGAIYRVEGEQVRVLKLGPRSTLYRA